MASCHECCTIGATITFQRLACAESFLLEHEIKKSTQSLHRLALSASDAGRHLPNSNTPGDFHAWFK
jgi:hypothetical protein